MPTNLSVLYNDLYRFDLATSTWNLISSGRALHDPSPRYSFGFASLASGQLCVFGGIDYEGASLLVPPIRGGSFQPTFSVRQLAAAAYLYANAAFALALPWQLNPLISIIFHAGLVNNLFVYNLTSEKWADTGFLTGDPAPARIFSGFVAAAGKLYVHAGTSELNAFSSELLIYLLRVYDANRLPNF